MNLIQPILNHAKTRPSAPAVVDGDREISYAELAALVLRTVAHLTTRGVAPGHRVGICLRDGWQHVVALLAVARLGALAVPLHWRAASAETAQLAASLSVAAVLAEPDSALPLACPVLAVDAEWHRRVDQCDPATDLSDDWDAPFVIAATSGSTSAPKFSVVSHLQFYCGIAAFNELFALSGPHRYLATLPIYFAGGRLSVLMHLHRGDCVLFHGTLVNGPDFIQAVTALNATVGFVIPSMIRDLLATPGREPLLPGLARLTSGGAPLFAEEKRDALRRISPGFCEAYGTAETNAISLLRSEDIAARAGSVGQPHSLAEIQVVGEDDRPLPTGEPGKLRVRGPTLASPLAAPGVPVHTGFRDGWYYPGEIAALDDRGFIHLAGRTSELIMRRGAKIHPAEVEAVLQQHPDVLECAVLGQRGASNEEEVIAFIASRAAPDLAAMVAHCRTYLAPAKRPQHIRFIDALPKNVSGKIDKRALARLLADPP